MSDIITTRAFANDNNINVLTLRGFIQNDETIRPAFTRSRINYYNLERLTNWLNKNIWRFKRGKKEDVFQTRDFFCIRFGVYRAIELKRKPGCCVECKKAAASRVIIDAPEKAVGNLTDTVKTRIDDIAAARVLNDVVSDSWMNAF